MKFIVDTQLPPALANFISQKGHHSTHTSFYNNGVKFTDIKITQVALEEERVIVTKDNDFFERFIVKGSPPKILLLQVGNSSNKELISIVENALELIVDYFQKNSNLIILTRDSAVCYH